MIVELCGLGGLRVDGAGGLKGHPLVSRAAPASAGTQILPLKAKIT